MKKILHITCQRPKRTGSGIFLKALVQNAARKGYSQAVVAGVVEEDLADWKGDVPIYPVVFESRDLPFPVVGMSDVMPYKSTRYSDMDGGMMTKWEDAFTGVLEKAIEEFEPDVIISHHLWLVTCIAAQKSRGIPVIGVCHGTDLRQLQLCPLFMERVTSGCRKLCGVIALNEHQKETISEIYSIPRESIAVSGCGYDSSKFNTNGRKTSKGETVQIVYAGKLSFSKGLLELIEALEGIGDKVRLVMAGAGSGEEERLIREKALKSKVEIEFAGMLSHDELSSLFKRSDLFVLPSFYEGLPLVLMEALASGMRVVSTDIPGVRDWIGSEINESGAVEYVDLPRLNTDRPYPQDVQPFVERLKASISNQIENFRNSDRSWIESARDSIESKSWESVFGRIEKCIKEKALQT